MPCWITQISLGLTFILPIQSLLAGTTLSQWLHIPSELSSDIQSPLLGHDEKVPVAVVDGPVGHGLVAGEHVDRYPVPGLAVSRSCSNKDDILSPLNLISPETRDEVRDSLNGGFMSHMSHEPSYQHKAHQRPTWKLTFDVPQLIIGHQHLVSSHIHNDVISNYNP